MLLSLNLGTSSTGLQDSLDALLDKAILKEPCTFPKRPSLGSSKAARITGLSMVFLSIQDCSACYVADASWEHGLLQEPCSLWDAHDQVQILKGLAWSALHQVVQNCREVQLKMGHTQLGWVARWDIQERPENMLYVRAIRWTLFQRNRPWRDPVHLDSLAGRFYLKGLNGQSPSIFRELNIFRPNFGSMLSLWRDPSYSYYKRDILYGWLKDIGFIPETMIARPDSLSSKTEMRLKLLPLTWRVWGIWPSARTCTNGSSLYCACRYPFARF